MPLPKGPSVAKTARKPERDTYRLTNITSEVCKTNPHPLAKRLTNFKQDFRDPIQIPRNLLSKGREVAGVQRDGPRCIEVGQIPED